MNSLKAGIVGRSLKKHERRVAVHPDHLPAIPRHVREQLVFETGYGRPFGLANDEIVAQAAGMASREQLFETCDLIVLPKPMHADIERMRPHQVLWGWAHAVQDPVLTQLAIDKRLTLITWESMNTWDSQGQWQSHIFRANNEIAGFAGVLHATGQMGITGCYGPPRKAIVINYGSVSRGAVRALQGLGFGDVTVLTLQLPELVQNKAPGVTYRQMIRNSADQVQVADEAGPPHPLIDLLASADIIVNGILQDPDRPLMFVRDEEVDRLKSGCLIIDISCDAGMGFPFARPTAFDNPIFQVGRASYYGVDHTPSYLWNSASWEISRTLLPFLPTVLAGPAAWDKDETIRRAIEIRDGIIQNPKIVSFQKRAAEYPHPRQNQEAVS